MKISLIDRYRTLLGAYYGVREMDEYDLKAYVLKDINNYIEGFIKENKFEIDYNEEKKRMESKVPTKTKLQDALLILNELNGDKELLSLIKKRIRKIERSNLDE